MSFDGYDAWKSTPPDDHDNEHAEDDMHEQEHEDHIAALKVWLENATGVQLRMAGQLLESERRRRLSHHAAELRSLGAQLASGDELPRKRRSDAGKPRKLPANDTQPDADPFEVSR